jgi:4-amino-4-deoxy-L-arabinose transferase-like glycosyltransferase
LGAALGTLTVALVAALAGRIAGTTGALIAAMIAAVYPGAIGMSILVLSEMLFMPLMLGCLLCWLIAYQSHSMLNRRKWAVVGGLIGGLAILTRPSWLLFVPFVAIIALPLDSRRRVHLEIAILAILGTCLAMAPWWIRNAGITGKFVPTTLQTGASLYDGLHQGASGASDEGMRFMQEIERQQRQDDAVSSQPLESTFEWRVNQRATRLALQWASENPKQAFVLALKKFTRTWSLWPDGGDLSSGAMRAAITISTFSVLLLAISASWHLREGKGWMIAFCWMPCLYFTALHLVFVGSIRYREPAMLVLVALAGCEVAKWFHKTQTVKTVTCATSSSPNPPFGKSSID